MSDGGAPIIEPELTDEGKSTITHVARRDLPWRRAALTECGLDLGKHAAISPQELEARAKKMGQQRTAMLTCMTCWQTSYRYGYSPGYDLGWKGPGGILVALEREIQWVRRHPDAGAFLADLKAIEVLIQRHRAEFDELIVDQAETVSLADERKARRLATPAKPRRKW